MKVEDFLKNNKAVITNVKYTIIKTKEKDNGVIIYLDNKEKINISVEDYFKYGINSLKGLDDNLYDILKNEERLYLGYIGSLRKLSIKDFSTKQIEDYLYLRFKLNKDEISVIVNKLKEYDLLNDERYCENRVNYLNKQLLSIKQIKAKLKKEGLEQSLIDSIAVVSNDDEYDKVLKLANKYSKTIKNKSVSAVKQSIANILVNMGYNYDNVIDAINSLNISVDNELELLNKEYTKAKNKYSKKYEGYDLTNHIYAHLVSKGYKSKDIKKVMED